MSSLSFYHDLSEAVPPMKKKNALVATVCGI